MATSVSIGYAPPHSLQQTSSSSTTIHLDAMITANSSYVRPFGRIPFLLLSRSCRFALSETAAQVWFTFLDSS